MSCIRKATMSVSQPTVVSEVKSAVFHMSDVQRYEKASSLEPGSCTGMLQI